ncbi:MAG: CCA tRNA nucleotidyltransferase [Anaerolineae bacterium]|nr:CCA tRNA nucleotidyltransferase [Anaerolineae bacterium]
MGGASRDGLLRCPQIGDLDFVIEGDAITFARALQHAHGGEVQPHEKFRTATWVIDEEHAFDFATARAETYPRPALLPEVKPTDILTDLGRRDFAINAIAMRLSDGELLDPFDGQGDLKRGVIRILHPRSFIDDPTRLLRAARYAARFNFTLDATTEEAIESGLPHLRSLSGERVKYDLELMFEEAEPERALLLLQRWGVFRAVGIPVPDEDRLCARFARIRKAFAEAEWPFESLSLPAQEVVRAVSWGALTYNTGQLSVSRWVDWLPFVAEVRDALVSLGALSTLSSQMFRGGKPSVNSALLKDFSGLALLMGHLFDPDALKRKAAICEWRDWRWVRPVTNGDDLRNLGVEPGPIYAKLLGKLRAAWLDSEVKSLAEEQALLQTLLEDGAA